VSSLVAKRASDPATRRPSVSSRLHEEGFSYRLIARNVGLSKNIVMAIVRRQAAIARGVS